jgi:hypothetical protein
LPPGILSTLNQSKGNQEAMDRPERGVSVFRGVAAATGQPSRRLDEPSMRIATLLCRFLNTVNDEWQR